MEMCVYVYAVEYFAGSENDDRRSKRDFKIPITSYVNIMVAHCMTIVKYKQYDGQKHTAFTDVKQITN